MSHNQSKKAPFACEQNFFKEEKTNQVTPTEHIKSIFFFGFSFILNESADELYDPAELFNLDNVRY